MWLKRERYRNPKRLAWVRAMSCMHCYAPPPSEAHHWAPKGQKGMGMKVGDDSVVPLCGPFGCHAHFHATGKLPGLTRTLTESDFKRELKRLEKAWEAGW